MRVHSAGPNPRSTTLSGGGVGVPPDGGWGWAVLAGTVLVSLLIPGTIKSFGVLFVEFMEVFDATPVTASWIPAICYFLYCSLGPLSSYLCMKTSYRTVTMIGGIFASAGMILSYFANSIEFLYLSYGVLVGTGAGLSYPPGIYIVSSYFVKRRGLANGLAVSGSAVGSILLPPFLRYLLSLYGYRGATLIMGGLTLNVVAAALLYEPVELHLVPGEETEGTQERRWSDAWVEGGPLVDASRSRRSPERPFLSLASEPAYLFLLAANCAGFIGYVNFSVLLPAYALELGCDLESAANLLSLLSALDLAGRVGGAALSDWIRLDKSRFMMAGLLGSGGALAALPQFSTSYPTVVGLCALFGLASGVHVGVIPLALTEALGERRLVPSYGVTLFFGGLLQLAGPPLCGLLQEYTGHYGPVISVLGGILLVGGVLCLPLPLFKKKTPRPSTNLI